MDTTPRIERLTREAVGPPRGDRKPAPVSDPDVARWQHIRRIVSTVILSLFLFGLWTLGLVSALRPLA